MNSSEKGDGEEKTTAQTEKDFFVRIFRRLSENPDPSKSILGILGETCEFFGLYSGFVYEADHQHVFHLCEHCPDSTDLRKEFLLEDCFDKANISELTGEIVYLNSRKNRLGVKFLELFSARTLVMVPVLFEKEPVAFVGLMDRRRPIRLSRKKIDDADAVLSVLAGHIQTRIYHNRLELAYSTLKNVVDKTGVDIQVNDFYTHEVLFVNESQEASRKGVDKILGRPCWKSYDPNQEGPCTWCPQSKLLNPDGTPGESFSWDFERSDGRWFRVINAVFYWVDGRLVHSVRSIDITESKKNEELIKHLAETDGLTSLPNRRKFMEDFQKSLEAAKKSGQSGYLLFMDLDDFKKINDTHGHLAGDGLLGRISAFLIGEASEYGTAYRYGGDEFVVILENRTETDLNKFKDLVLSNFAKGWDVEEQTVRCGISIGAVRFPDRDKITRELIQDADMMMYEVKKHGKHGFKLHL